MSFRKLMIVAAFLAATPSHAQYVGYGTAPANPGYGYGATAGYPYGSAQGGYGAAPATGYGYGSTGLVGQTGVVPQTQYGYGGYAYGQTFQQQQLIQQQQELQRQQTLQQQRQTVPGTQGRSPEEVTRAMQSNAVNVTPTTRNPKGQRLEGVAKVTDGNTLVLGSDVIVLDGADAPELGQNCTGPDGLAWQCGRRSMDRLVQLAHGRKVVCVGQSMSGTAVVARCKVGWVDLGRTMVAEGWAMSPKAVSSVYASEEVGARGGRKGVWAGTAATPWEYRSKN